MMVVMLKSGDISRQLCSIISYSYTRVLFMLDNWSESDSV